MSWNPSNEPVRYDRNRVATFKPVREVVESPRLPLLRLRKQIEDGGDNPMSTIA